MRFLLSTVLLMMSVCCFSQTRKINAESAIQHVIVYFSGARVERSSTVNLPAGRSEVSFTGLSNQLDPQTIQLKADAGITLLSVQTAKDFLTARKVEEEERSLIEKAEQLKEKINQDAKTLEVYRNEETMLIKNQAIGGQAGVKAADLREALDLQRQRLTEVYARQSEIQKRLNASQLELTRIDMQRREISKKKDSTTYVVTALLDSKQPEQVHFMLMYNVADAGWYPSYNIKITDVNRPVNLLMNAGLFQRSGETWKNVSLVLSTGDPNANATPTILDPWKLGFYDNSSVIRVSNISGTLTGRVTDPNQQPIVFASVTVAGNRNNATATDVNGFFKLQNVQKNSSVQISAAGYEPKTIAMSGGYASVVLNPAKYALNDVVISAPARGMAVTRDDREEFEDKKKEMIQTVSSATTLQPTTMEFRIDEKYTIETDGKTTTIGILERELPVTYDYYSAPKIDPSAFLTSRLVNWQDFNLQSGEASLFYEGTFLGKTYIDLSNTGDTLDLALGRDKGVSVNRKLLREYSTRKFMGNSRTETKDFEITVRNNKRTAVNISLYDQFPVSVTKDIVVEDVQAPESEIDKETGIVKWSLVLAPGQEKKLKFTYSVKYPKDRKVVLE